MSWNKNNILDLVSVIADIEAAGTAQELFDKYASYSHGYGFNHTAIGLVANPALSSKPASHYAITNFPRQFQTKYNNENYLLHDPIIRYAMLSNAIFQWRAANEHASKFGKKIYDEMQDYALFDGLCIPMKVGYFPKGIISMSHENPDLSQKDLTNLHLVSIHTYTHFLKLLDVSEFKSLIDLSKREVEVLHYVAGGKSNWEIGVILGVSEDCIKKHMGNITRKLDAMNRAHAVILGVKSGQILP